ncbi:MAG: pseudouridine synthase [Terracidiphilus sp.]|jgi:23S rRNA pseudouridine2605 synthase
MTHETDDLHEEPAKPESAETELEATPETVASEIADPIGDETDGEAKTALDAETEAGTAPDDEGDDAEFTPQPRPPAKLERLQKILAQAGVSSRRRAEELIEQGRVQVNGKVVTVLGTKADAGRDHIRVDGKLLQGAERLRYFVLNKPKGFVTTVKDPEGRPTVMQFFEKMKERLYPVGRLDYMSEGLLVVTNDGELANRLTKAASGVEKTYLVKVAGQPTEAELDILRGGVAIERGKPGSPQVRTSPARVRQVRQGDNPWYEVVLIEGRNRELRKMFEEIGHFVEKIRRVGYGPLVLDQEPGKLRELQPEEVDALRKAAEGKLRTPKAKEVRRRNLLDAGLLPTVLPKPSSRPRSTKLSVEPPDAAARPSDFRPKKFGSDRPVRGAAPFAKPFRPASGRTPDRGPARADDRPRRNTGAGPARFGSAPASGSGKPAFRRDEDQSSFQPRPARPAWKKDDRPTRPPARFVADSTGENRQAPGGFVPDRPTYDRPRMGSPRQGSAGTGRTGGGRPFSAKPSWKKPERSERSARPAFKRPAPPRREAPAFDEDRGPVRPPNLHIEEIKAEGSSHTRPTPSRPSVPRFSSPHPGSSRPSAPRSYSDRPRPSRPSFDRPASSERSGAAKPFRSAGGPERNLPRPFTTSSGKPRAGGARPSSKPGRPSDHSSAGPAKRNFRRDEGKGSFTPRSAAGSGPRPSGSRPPSSSKPYTPRTEGTSDYRPTQSKPYPKSAPRAERKAGPGWKPKPSFGGKGKPASGSHSKSKPGGFSKSGYKGKPGGRPGGKKRK